MLAILLIALYALMIELFGIEIGQLFATIFLFGMIAMMKISKVTGLDKKLDEWL